MSSKSTFARVKEFLARVPEELADKEVQVGWLGNVNEENGTPVAYVATIHEYGSPGEGIPARPMLGPTMKENTEAYLKFLKLAVKQVQDGKSNGQDALDTLGELVEGDVRKTISQVTSPQLKLATVRRKGHSKPLIDSETMLDAVTHEIVKK